MINKDILVLIFFLISMMTLKGFSMPGSCYEKLAQPNIAKNPEESESEFSNSFVGYKRITNLARSLNEKSQATAIIEVEGLGKIGLVAPTNKYQEYGDNKSIILMSIDSIEEGKKLHKFIGDLISRSFSRRYGNSSSDFYPQNLDKTEFRGMQKRLPTYGSSTFYFHDIMAQFGKFSDFDANQIHQTIAAEVGGSNPDQLFFILSLSSNSIAEFIIELNKPFSVNFNDFEKKIGKTSLELNHLERELFTQKGFKKNLSANLTDDLKNIPVSIFNNNSKVEFSFKFENLTQAYSALSHLVKSYREGSKFNGEDKGAFLINRDSGLPEIFYGDTTYQQWDLNFTFSKSEDNKITLRLSFPEEKSNAQLNGQFFIEGLNSTSLISETEVSSEAKPKWKWPKLFSSQKRSLDFEHEQLGISLGILIAIKDGFSPLDTQKLLEIIKDISLNSGNKIDQLTLETIRKIASIPNFKDLLKNRDFLRTVYSSYATSKYLSTGVEINKFKIVQNFISELNRLDFNTFSSILTQTLKSDYFTGSSYWDLGILYVQPVSAIKFDPLQHGSLVTLPVLKDPQLRAFFKAPYIFYSSDPRYISPDALNLKGRKILYRENFNGQSYELRGTIVGPYGSNWVRGIVIKGENGQTYNIDENFSPNSELYLEN